MPVEPVDFAKRFPLQPASALAPRPPTVGGDRRNHTTTGTTSTIVHAPEPERPVEAAVPPEPRRKLTGYPGHTSHRAQRRLNTAIVGGSPRVQNGVQGDQQAVQRDVVAATSGQQRQPSDRRPGEQQQAGVAHGSNVDEGEARTTSRAEDRSEGAAPQVAAVVVVSQSVGPSVTAEHPQTAAVVVDGLPPTAAATSPRGVGVTPSSYRGALNAVPSPQHRTASRSSMLTAGDGEGERRSRGALSANQIARVERSEQRKVLLEQQLALERAYWNTKASFQGLRAHAEKQIYTRELTALWTERTDSSPYWTNQVKEMEAAHEWTRQWRRHPEFVQSARSDANLAKQQLLGNTFSGVALSLLHQDAGAAFDHRLTAPMPPANWTSVTCMYQQHPNRIIRPLSPPHQLPPLVKSPRSARPAPPAARQPTRNAPCADNSNAGCNNTNTAEVAEAAPPSSLGAPQWTAEPPTGTTEGAHPVHDDSAANAEAPTRASEEL